MIKNKKSQAWGIDLMIASFIFIIGITSFYLYALNSYEKPEETLKNLQYDGKIISDIILSEGYPKNWTESNVVSIGVLSDGKINSTKLQQFYDLTLADYSKTKLLFNTKYDYFFFFDENMNLSSAVSGIGKPSTDINNLPAQDLIKITRFIIYQDKPTTAYLYIWQN